MPQVRCPDCFQEVTVMHHELSRVIQCPICEAQIGPLVSPPPGTPAPPPPPAAAPAPPSHPAPPPAEAGGEHLGDAGPKPRTKGKRVQQKSVLRFLPLVIGLVVGLGGSAALLGAIYVLIKAQMIQLPPPEPTPPPAKADPPPSAPPAKSAGNRLR